MLKRRRDPAAVNSRLIRRPIQRMFWLFLLPMTGAFCIGFVYPFFEGPVFVLLQVQDDEQVDMGGSCKLRKGLCRRELPVFVRLRRSSPFVSLIIINVLAFAVAYALTQGIKGTNVFRTGSSSCRTSLAASCWATSGA